MKRRDLVQHLTEQGCELLREGANHSIYVNRAAAKASAVPRHSEINEYLAKKIAGTSEFRLFTQPPGCPAHRCSWLLRTKQLTRDPCS